MEFDVKPFHKIKNNISSIGGYLDILKKHYQVDIQDCIASHIDTYCSKLGDTWRYVLVYDGEQIADCKVSISHDSQIFFVSSIAIIPNLQRQGIASSFYKKVIIPNMKKLYPTYKLSPAPKQTDLGKKLRESNVMDFIQSPEILDTQSAEREK